MEIFILGYGEESSKRLGVQSIFNPKPKKSTVTRQDTARRSKTCRRSHIAQQAAVAAIKRSWI